MNRSPSRPLFLAGALALSVALVATAVLSLDAVLLLTPPGCGEGSGCERAARSVWARVPGVDWPVSVLAFSYFLAIGIAWFRARGSSRGFVWIVRAGALGSLGYLALLFAGRYVCPWCLAAHVGTLGFLVVSELATRRGGARTLFGFMAVVFVAASALLLLTRGAVQREKVEVSLPASQSLTVTYAGRLPDGPEVAPIRIVAYSDYQCPDCRRIEGAIRSLVDSREDVVVSSKNFPMCADCNPYMKGKTLHANSCWAARAVEAAALLHGAAGRRTMHRWLFERGGSFTDREIREAVTALGWDAREFLALMQSESTLAVVRRDVDEAKSLGIFFTPLVFVNGVELKWRSGRALDALVEAIAKTAPAPRRFDADPLPLAAGKMITDWSESTAQSLDAAAGEPCLGPPDAPVEVTVWGDLQEPNTAILYARLRERISERADVRFRFLHYPLNESCNPAASSTRYSQACLAARCAEAARRLAGSDGFWRMLDWLFENQGRVTQESVREAAASLGLDPTLLLETARSPEVAETIARHSRARERLGIRFLPMVWIDGRRAERWQAPDLPQDVLTMLLDTAASEAQSPH